MFFANIKAKKDTEILYDRLEQVKRDLSSLALELEKVKTQLLSLRGLINRKFSKDEDNKETTDINNPVILPHNGFIK